MSKVKRPLLSLGATGKLGDIAFRKHRHISVAEKIPVLPYFLTLPVQYQRWLYQDYCELWGFQYIDTRAAYASAGSRHHLTAFQYWMKDMLTRLPDLAAFWKLDINGQPTTPDSSRNGNTATVGGASPAAGIIDGCFFFDGLDDYLQVEDHPSLNITQNLTLLSFIRPESVGPDEETGIIQKNVQYILRTNDDDLRFFLRVDNIWHVLTISNCLQAGQWHTCMATYSEASRTMILRCNDRQNSLVLSGLADYSINVSTNVLYIGYHSFADRYFYGRIDNPVIYNRVLEISSFDRWHLRRFPPV